MEKGLAFVCCPVKSFCTKLLVRLFLCFLKLIGPGAVVIHNFHSRETALSQAQGFLCQNQSD